MSTIRQVFIGILQAVHYASPVASLMDYAPGLDTATSMLPFNCAGPDVSCVIMPVLIPSSTASCHMVHSQAIRRSPSQPVTSGLGDSASGNMLRNPLCFVIQGNTSSTLALKPVLGQAKRKAPPRESTEAAMKLMEETPMSTSTPAATLAKGSLAEILDRLAETIRAQSGAIEQQSEIIRQQSEAIATLNRRMGIMEAKVVDVSRPKVVGKVKKAQQNSKALAKCTTLKGMLAN
ncbi:hypothetical protein HPB50_002576 [Hyalomma asiaticum]|uniref:Uncharacterized protein n=1 Tax=Hyalomma asiaticum TaxID=266040 RepID=A0ACB7TBG5_HYAAI|nr:hypothetical protein HPB50_002576 [Hyalomma asiaticum]